MPFRDQDWRRALVGNAPIEDILRLYGEQPERGMGNAARRAPLESILSGGFGQYPDDPRPPARPDMPESNLLSGPLDFFRRMLRDAGPGAAGEAPPSDEVLRDIGPQERTRAVPDRSGPSITAPVPTEDDVRYRVLPDGSIQAEEASPGFNLERIIESLGRADETPAREEPQPETPAEAEAQERRGLFGPDTSNILLDLGLSLMSSQRPDFLGALGEAGQTAMAGRERRQDRAMAQEQAELEKRATEARISFMESQAEAMRTGQPQFLNDESGRLLIVGRDGEARFATMNGRPVRTGRAGQLSDREKIYYDGLMKIAVARVEMGLADTLEEALGEAAVGAGLVQPEAPSGGSVR